MNYARKLVEGSLEIEDVETEVHSLLQTFVESVFLNSYYYCFIIMHLGDGIC